MEIDFDEASKIWMRNKKKIGNGAYRYVCGAKKRFKDGYCKNETENNHRARIIAKTPGTSTYMYGFKITPNLNWSLCVAHKYNTR